MTEQLFMRTIFALVVFVSLFNGLRLILSESVRKAYYKRYRLTCYGIAAACLCIAIGNILPAIFIGLDRMPDEPFSLIIECIAASELVLIASANIILYTNNKTVNRRLAIWASIYLAFPIAYFIATRVQSDVVTHNTADFFKLLPDNIPALIRFLFLCIYVVGLGHFTRIFFQERHAYIEETKQATALLPDQIKLNWVKYAYLSALFEGLSAALLSVFPIPPVHAVFWIITIIFYAVFPFYYINYGKTYNHVRKTIDDFNQNNDQESALDENTDEGMDQMIVRFINRNNILFQKIEQLTTSGAFLDPNFSPDEMASQLCTNRTYLASAIRQNRNQTVSNYILTLRLDHVVKLLKEHKEMKIEDVALLSGFNTLRTFNRNFKDKFGVTPEEFRNKTT